MMCDIWHDVDKQSHIFAPKFLVESHVFKLLGNTDPLEDTAWSSSDFKIELKKEEEQNKQHGQAKTKDKWWCDFVSLSSLGIDVQHHFVFVDSPMVLEICKHCGLVSHIFGGVAWMISPVRHIMRWCIPNMNHPKTGMLNKCTKCCVCLEFLHGRK